MKELSLDIVVPCENLDRVYTSKFFKYDKKYVEESQKEFGFRYVSHVKESHYEEASFENGKAVFRPVKENETEVHRVTVYPCVSYYYKGHEETAPLTLDPFEKTGLRAEGLEEALHSKQKNFKLLIVATADMLKKNKLKLSDIVKNADEVKELREKGFKIVWCVWEEMYQNYAPICFERDEDGNLQKTDGYQQAIGNVLDEIEFQVIDPWNAILEEGNEAGYYRFKE